MRARWIRNTCGDAGEQNSIWWEQEDDPPDHDVDGEGAVEPVESKPQGKLIVDATVADQAIRYPTDLSLLNEAREFSEQLIDALYPKTAWRS